MASGDLAVTGTTVSDISNIVVYYDVTNNNLYDEKGDLYGNTFLSTTFDNKFVLEIHYVQKVSTDFDPTTWSVWDGLQDASNISSELAFDDDYVHAAKASLSSAMVSGSTSCSVVVSNDGLDADTLDSSGVLIINPYGINESEVLSGSNVCPRLVRTYSSFSHNADTGVYTFILNESVSYNVPINTVVRVGVPRYFYVDSSSIYEANIPARYKEGVFRIPIHVSSRKLLKTLDTTNVSKITGIIEHKIYTRNDAVSNISVSGTAFNRNKTGDLTLTYNGNVCTFCNWRNGSTSYWTIGNTIENNTHLYSISGSTVTLLNVTANPIYDTDSILFRTFTFPFTVHNLVEYSASMSIPMQDYDWMHDYILSVVVDSIPGTVPFNTSEFIVSDKVYIKKISADKITGLTINSASVKNILEGTNGSGSVNVTSLLGSLTAGQAVDVTSEPDQTITGDYKGTFTTSASTLGFSAFPKFAKNFVYLYIADVTVATTRTVTPSGTWLDGTSTAKTLTSGQETRLAMLFTSSEDTCSALFTFSSTGALSVHNFRQYEVTVCTDEAISYIAQLDNPDSYESYYLVEPDMIQPWTKIIDMKSSPFVTIASGLSYKLNASSGVHSLTVDTCPEGCDGRDSIIRITLGGTGVIQTVSPLKLGGALTPYAINNCVVRFRDGEAVLIVEDTLAGYVVTVTSGTEDGSIWYGLTTLDAPYIAFSPSIDGTTVQLSGATTASTDVVIVGNGYSETTLTGDIQCTSKTIMTNLSLQDVGVSGGVLVLGDANLISGSTVTVSGGGLAVEKVRGNGEINFGGTHSVVSQNQSTYASGCSFTYGNGSSGDINVGGAFTVYDGNATFVSCLFKDNVANNGGAIYGSGGSVSLTGCTVTDNTAIYGGGLCVSAGMTVDLVDTIVSDNSGGGDIQIGATTRVNISGGCDIGTVIFNGSANVGSVYLYGSNTIYNIKTRNTLQKGYVSIEPGTILNLSNCIATDPIFPRNAIVLPARPADAPVTILYGDNDSRTFNELEITGTSISNQGIIVGATVTIPEGNTREWYLSTTTGVTSRSTPGSVVIDGGLTGIEEV